ncbi:transposase [Collinsella stercoris]|uniref:transposase n=1 Tax=Collinsella stercoris TaxID=147206 RepID=UPI0034E94BD0
MWLDATYVPCREAGAPRSVALVTAVACSGSARRRVVGIERIDTESHLSWRGFLLSLRSRVILSMRNYPSTPTKLTRSRQRPLASGASRPYPVSATSAPPSSPPGRP